LTKEEGKEWLDRVRVLCPKFGGKRLAPVCVHSDRYRYCRMGCHSIEKIMKDNPDLLKESKEFYKNYTKDKKGYNVKSRHSWVVHGPPKEKIPCPHCKFKALTQRGLKSHLTRSHKDLGYPKK